MSASPKGFGRHVLVAIAGGLITVGCGGATRSASPRSPANATGTAQLTGAQVTARFQKVLVAEKGAIAMVGRGGCVATITSAKEESGELEEMRVRCPRPERLTAWFAGVDKIIADIPVERLTEEEEDEEDVVLPAAELVTPKGDIVHVTQRADAERLASEVRALSAELASSEMPSPGPKSPKGWEMLHVAGPARVMLAGAPTMGVLDARMSTTGQYLCEFVATTGQGPVRATKGGWLPPATAAKAIDEVLVPFADTGATDRRPATFASGVAGGDERRANPASTAAVFKRFSYVQDALGDACLPELEPPGGSGSNQGTGQIGL